MNNHHYGGNRKSLPPWPPPVHPSNRCSIVQRGWAFGVHLCPTLTAAKGARQWLGRASLGLPLNGFYTFGRWRYRLIPSNKVANIAPTSKDSTTKTANVIQRLLFQAKTNRRGGISEKNGTVINRTKSLPITPYSTASGPRLK
jgi:hypothetical protein